MAKEIVMYCRDMKSLIKMKVAYKRLKDSFSFFFGGGQAGMLFSVNTHTSQRLMKLSKFNDTVK